ncbi:hypothetical protein INT47_007768 [Mucor saturninus]|uniref:Uncharacterized protein n=1 Tax=Mucor saturninus TaxID=64648 RepID=A0A8H7V666_9FUNG|nr:hypothetical protein INT47_007768 [Mucor saturninus]
MRIQEVPTEICREIFFLSENPYQCALVCKSWTEHALQVFYNDLTLGAFGIYRTKQELKMIAKDRDGFFKYANLVKKLTIGENNDRSPAKFPPKNFIKRTQHSDLEFDRHEFITLLECLPNLESLHISLNVQDENYLQYILETDSKTCLNNIQSITSDRSDIQFSLYYKYRATITTLKVNDQRDIVNVDSRWGGMLTLLSHFPKMTDLTLINPPNNVTTFDVQKACPSLISFEFNADFDLSDERALQILDNPANFDSNNSLKMFRLALPTMSKAYISYLAEYMCIQLDTFEVEMFDINLYDWLIHVGMDSALKFAKQIGKMEEFSFSCMANEMYLRRTFSDKANITGYFELLNGFRGDKNPYCRIEFCDVNGFSAEDFVEYNAHDGLNLRCKLDYKDYRFPYQGAIEGAQALCPYADDRIDNDNDRHVGEKHDSVDDNQSSDNDSSDDDIQTNYGIKITSPDRQISVIGLEVVNYMHVTMSDRHPDLPFKFIEYAFTHCPNLEYFHFGFLEEPAEEFCITTVINPRKLKINHQVTSTNPQENMKVVKTADFVPSDEWLNFVVGFVPDIEIFALGDHNLDSTTPDMTEIDLTCFKKLKTIYFLMEVISKGDANMAFIHFKYSDGDEAYFCQECANPLALNMVDLVNFQNCCNNEALDTRCITIFCEKHIQIVVYSDEHGTIGEINDGRMLDYVRINSNFFRTISII